MVDIWLAALTYWYLTGLLAALAFSFGFYLVRPGSPVGTPTRDWLAAFHWEGGGFYTGIATRGYRYRADAPSSVAFFPVYPLASRAVMTITGVRAEVALLMVSNCSFLGALVLLAFYVRERYPLDPVHLRDYALLAMAFFPTGCFFRLTYSESTFLFVTILAMYAMLRRWPLWTVALIIGLATAARPLGVALLAPFAIHICRRPCAGDRQLQPAGVAAREGGVLQVPGAARFWRLMPGLRRLTLYLPLACWGLGLFMIYQYYAFGEPLAFVKVQKNWGTPLPWGEKTLSLATLKPVWSVYDARSPAYWTQHDPHSIPWFSLQFANPIFFISAAALIAYGAFRRLPGNLRGAGSTRWLSLEEAALGVLLLLIPYVTRAGEMGMGSMGRFVAVAFPVYLVLGRLLASLPGALRVVLFVFSGCFLLIYTALYAARYQIY